ncbi:MAG: DUF4911 domain-containing protein [Desulfovibrio sp.]|nr:DUF4911 domain-containing protein [Desulfovibrio sp.]
MRVLTQCDSSPPVPRESGCLLIRLAREHTAMFRFLLEAYENLAYFTVLERKTALLKLVFSPHQRENVLRALDEIALSVPLSVREWPL